MAKRIPYLWSLVVGGMLLAGCAATSFSGEDPHFPGFHSNHSGDGITPIIVDRSQLGTNEKRPNLPPVQPDGDEPGNNRAYEDSYQRDFSSQYNLVYHLYGPDHYRPYGRRYWLSYRRQWGQLPWYGRDPYYNSWWNDPYWSWEYRWNSWAWDPWFDHFYDPYYWDPYWGYNSGYGYQYAYHSGYNPWRNWGYHGGSSATKSDKGRKQARSRKRRDLTGSQGDPTTSTALAGAGTAKASSNSSGSAGDSNQRRSNYSQASSSSVKSQKKSSDSSSGNNGKKQTRKRKRKF